MNNIMMTNWRRIMSQLLRLLSQLLEMSKFNTAAKDNCQDYVIRYGLQQPSAKVAATINTILTKILRNNS
jgi:hypothetical protein